jgi:hypothetical protein
MTLLNHRHRGPAAICAKLGNIMYVSMSLRAAPTTYIRQTCVTSRLSY